VARIELRDFDGDLQALSTVARESWLEEYGTHSFPDLYQPELARHLFADVPDPRFLIGAYDGARLVGFVANLPRNYMLNGRAYKSVYSCMLVCHKNYRGAAVYLIAESLRRNEELGAELALMTLEKPYHSWHMFHQYLKPHWRIQTLKRMYPILHAVDFECIVTSENLKRYEVAAIKLFGAHRPIPAPPVAGVVRPYMGTDLYQVFALTRCLAGHKCLARTFDEASLARHLQDVGAAFTMVYERGGKVAGFVNSTVRSMINRRGSQRWAWLDFLHWQELDGREKQALLAGVWQACRQRGCIGILEWSKGYYAAAPLFHARFVPYPRFLDVDAWILNPTLPVGRIDGVFEQVI
jgi:hypothetical protein